MRKLAWEISPSDVQQEAVTKFTRLFSSRSTTANGAQLNHTARSCFALPLKTALSFFFSALKFSWTAASQRRVRRYSSAGINIGSPVPSSLERQRERHKQAHCTAVFMGKRVEKPSLALICPKWDLWQCVKILCIDSSHADRRNPILNVLEPC